MRRAHSWLLARPYAHRGLHGGDIPENSLAAFRRAVDAGYGIECDVRLTRDNVPHVFHDARLERLTNVPGTFEQVDRRRAAMLQLRDGSPVPSLRAMLDYVAGRAPILVEVKTGRSAPHRLCSAIAAELDRYYGPVAIMSFDPRVSGWFAAHRRHLLRGLVISRRDHPRIYVAKRHALAIRRARPHFLAGDIRDQSIRPIRRPALPTLFWTIRSRTDGLRAQAGQGQIIFEQSRRD